MNILYYQIVDISSKSKVIYFAYEDIENKQLKIASMDVSNINLEFIRQSKAQNIDKLKSNKHKELAYFIEYHNLSN